MTAPRLIQMAGHCGAGKSTLARQLADRVDAAVIDLDVIRTGLLGAGVDWELASKASYETIYALVDDLLGSSGVSVIVDTPSYWVQIHERLTQTADAHGARYVFVECEASERTRAGRLSNRSALPSQCPALGERPAAAPADLDGWLFQRPIQRPINRPCVAISTEAPVDVGALLASLTKVPG